ncbi:UNVERIFIED_CONTAM: hypothetical protein FKN15_030503 [Acipenser sinensis]
MFVMDEDSTSQDCEPYCESDTEEEGSTDDSSLSEDPPLSSCSVFSRPAPPSRSLSQQHLARSLPVSVPIWGYREFTGGHAPSHTESHSGEQRVSITSERTTAPSIPQGQRHAGSCSPIARAGAIHCVSMNRDAFFT